MNILFLISYAGRGGSEKYVDNLSRIFSQGGEKCHFAYNVDGQLSETMRGRGYPTLQTDMGRLHAVSAARALADFCQVHDIDVIHAQYPRENIIAILSMRYYSKPRVVYTNHLTIRSGLRWRVLNRLYTPRNHRIIAVCREGRDIMLANGVCGERMEVIYNGVEPGDRPERDPAVRGELGVDESAFMMTILARYAPEKGLSFLVESLARLRELTERPFVCVICGEGELYGEIGELIRERGLEGRVLQAGFRRDGGRVLSASDLYLNTSSHNEAMSFAILEAMNAGLPCVVTDVGGNRDLAETNTVCGAVVDYGDADAFALAIKAYMDDEALRGAHSQAALRKVAEEFDLNKLAWDVFRAYQ